MARTGKSLTVYVNDEQEARLRKAAKKGHRTLSSVVNEALDNHFTKWAVDEVMHCPDCEGTNLKKVGWIETRPAGKGRKLRNE